MDIVDTIILYEFLFYNYTFCTLYNTSLHSNALKLTCYNLLPFTIFKGSNRYTK